jgi:hypothetical protein
MSTRRLIGALAAVAALAAPASASAATELVTEDEVARQVESSAPTKDWVIYNRATTPSAQAAFVSGPGSPPLGSGSLQFTTADGTQKLFAFNYDHVGKKLSEIDALAYSTYRTVGSAQQVTALNIQIDKNGGTLESGDFATLVFEPVYNTDQGPVTDGTWQTWTAHGSGVWWSTQPINGQCAGATATCDKTWSEIVANNPDATVVGGAGLNQGSGNPGLVAASDALTIDETTYDFEVRVDNDGDGVGDHRDNCVGVANPDQSDLDDDGKGDACDKDRDGDWWPNKYDNCADVPNPAQVDLDRDGIGTACDPVERPRSEGDCKHGKWRLWKPAFSSEKECRAWVRANRPGHDDDDDGHGHGHHHDDDDDDDRGRGDRD